MSGENLLLVFTNCVEGTDDAFNSWYDKVHVPDVLAVPGVVGADRYESLALTMPEGSDDQAPPPANVHRYLTVYRLSKEPDEVMAEFSRRMGDGSMPLDDTLDLSTVAMSTWRPRGTSAGY